jgi:hypothetical protein
LPTDLKFFIDHEVRDYKSRVDAAKNGQEPSQRSTPSGTDYINSGGKYKAYLLRDCLPGVNITRKKIWGVAPAAMILKASLGAFQPTIWSLE